MIIPSKSIFLQSVHSFIVNIKFLKKYYIYYKLDVVKNLSKYLFLQQIS